MAENRNRLADLLEKYSSNTLTEIEFAEFCEMVKQPENESLLKADFEMGLHETEFMSMHKSQLEKLLGEVLRAGGKERTTIPAQHKRPVIRLWRRVAVAASIILMLGVGSYFLFFNKTEKKDVVVNVPAQKDVEAPKGTKATITIADGRIISIDSLTSLDQANVEVKKTADGKIVYNGSANEVIFNTLTNPRGSKVIDMTLADGSHVWLNAGSSVTYPVSFIGNERKVSITGEAYFEVARNSTMPFVVNKADVQVQVLGTHFNVKAYDDESDIKVTLLEGSVEVKKGNASGLLKPGQQAKITTDVKIINNVDLEQVMAWKNGNFKFSRTDLKVIMREIGRWYDVEVIYEGNIPLQLYNVGVPRTANVSEVLKGLEYTGAHFSVEGKKIIVRP